MFGEGAITESLQVPNGKGHLGATAHFGQRQPRCGLAGGGAVLHNSVDWTNLIISRWHGTGPHQYSSITTVDCIVYVYANSREWMLPVEPCSLRRLHTDGYLHLDGFLPLRLETQAVRSKTAEYLH